MEGEEDLVEEDGCSSLVEKTGNMPHSQIVADRR
jgi:hypothetical protein